MSAPKLPRHEELEGIEYATAGGWTAALWDLTRWLRANGCADRAYELEQQAQAVPPGAGPQAERATLRAVFGLLPRLHNDLPRHLTQGQHEQLAQMRRAAARFVQFRLRQLEGEGTAFEQAVADVRARLDAIASGDAAPHDAADDPRNYQPAQKVVDQLAALGLLTTDKELRRLVDGGLVRHKKPSKQRLLVHVGDVLAAVIGRVTGAGQDAEGLAAIYLQAEEKNRTVAGRRQAGK
ncbi:MAG TPA: hypothetical protein VFB06_37695 [Streptosporangiaceae bacterium]|nr:hypothetical protein [Streptosporangiaceae bacterium]